MKFLLYFFSSLNIELIILTILSSFPKKVTEIVLGMTSKSPDPNSCMFECLYGVTVFSGVQSMKGRFLVVLQITFLVGIAVLKKVSKHFTQLTLGPGLAGRFWYIYRRNVG